jgi:hypothetical protein
LGSIAATKRTRSQAGKHGEGKLLNPSLNKIKRKEKAEGSLTTIREKKKGRA